MQKLSTVALSVQKLGWGGNFYPPPPIPLTYIKKPIPNRVKNNLFTNMLLKTFCKNLAPIINYSQEHDLK